MQYEETGKTQKETELQSGSACTRDFANIDHWSDRILFNPWWRSHIAHGISFGKAGADTSGAWNLILVDRDHYIPSNYQVELTELSNGEKVDSRIYPELQQMFDDARAAGLALFVREGYRTTKGAATDHGRSNQRI